MSTKKSKHHFLDEKELETVRSHLIPLFRDESFMYADQIRGRQAPYYNVDLMEVIAALYNMLHYEVTGVVYDYFFHWANKCGAWINDADFNDFLLDALEEVKDEN